MPENHSGPLGIFYFKHMRKKLTTEEFILKAQKVHGDKYDYSKSIYKSNQEKILITCGQHGDFLQLPSNHMRGVNCPKCAGKYKPTEEELKKQLCEIHFDKYDYSMVNYKSRHSMIKIICPKHGMFEQKANDHFRGSGCRKCGRDLVKNKFLHTVSEFVEKANKIHGYRYDYSKVEYLGTKIKVEIICKEHGSFWQSPQNHLHENNCPTCVFNQKVSKPEIEIQIFIGTFFNEEIVTNSRKIINPYELDIYIPSLKKAIEFNGLYWHYSKRHFKPGKHAHKSNLCREKGIKLLHVREDLWKRDPEKMKQVIQKFFKNDKTI